MTNGAGPRLHPCAGFELPDIGEPARPDRTVLSCRRLIQRVGAACQVHELGEVGVLDDASVPALPAGPCCDGRPPPGERSGALPGGLTPGHPDGPVESAWGAAGPAGGTWRASIYYRRPSPTR